MVSKDPFAGLEPAALWSHFANIVDIPRPSGQESAIAEWLVNWAGTHSFSFRRDNAGNICIYVPASQDMSGSAPVALQAHLDMVCVRAENSTSDPSKGNIEICREGEWIVAPNSTLGADNGIGIAAAMCVAESKDTSHGPLELLFTVEEETTGKGADELDPSLIHAEVMLNLDFETTGELPIGSAGGAWTVISCPTPTEPIPEDWLVVDITVSGLSGGHSGVDIIKNRLNGIKGIVWLMRRIAEDIPLLLCGLAGGDAVNAIPIRAQVTIALQPADAHVLEETIDVAAAHLARRFSLTDPDLSISKAKVNPKGIKCWSEAHRDRLLDLLATIPSGVTAMEQHAPELVETSNNLGIVAVKDGVVQVQCLTRSSVAAAQAEIVASIEAAARLAGVDFTLVPPESPPWRVSSDSALLAIVQASYRELFQRDPKLVTIHAGLECGDIQKRIPGLDVVSLGPDIQRAHKPGERVNIPSVAEFYTLLCEVVRRLAV